MTSLIALTVPSAIVTGVTAVNEIRHDSAVAVSGSRSPVVVTAANTYTGMFWNPCPAAHDAPPISRRIRVPANGVCKTLGPRESLRPRPGLLSPIGWSHQSAVGPPSARRITKLTMKGIL